VRVRSQRAIRSVRGGVEAEAAPLWPYLLLCGLLAVWIDLGNHHRFENADSVIPILVSLQKWTLFYWEQKRFGMLVPLLAIPFHSPLANLLVQNAITIFAGLSVGFLLARYFVAGRAWPLVGLLDTVLCLWLAPGDYRWRLLGTSLPYGAALALALAGLLLARGTRFRREHRGRIAAALIALLLAHWLSPATAVVVLALVWLPRVGTIARDPRHGWRDPEATVPSALVAASLAIVRIAAYLQPYGRSVYGVRSPTAWPAGWAALVGRLPEMLGSFDWFLVAGALGLAGLGVAWQRGRGAARANPAPRSVLVLIGAAILYWLAAGSIRWVVLNNGAFPRYLIPSVQLISSALAIAALAPWLDRERRPSTSVQILGGVAVLVAATLNYGFPSLAGVRSDLRDRLGRFSDEVLAADCTHLAGNYWRVWPAVFHVNMLRHAAGRDDVLWGIAFRSAPTGEQARLASGHFPRVCMLRDADPRRVEAYGFGSLSLVERRGAIDVYQPQPPSDVAPPGRASSGGEGGP